MKSYKSSNHIFPNSSASMSVIPKLSFHVHHQLTLRKKAVREETRETAAVEDTPKMAEGVIDSLLYSGLSTADLLVRS